MGYSLAAIAIGATLGAWLRWWCGLKLNTIFPLFPLGTLLVNWVGGFIIGFAVSCFAQSAISQNYKLMIITGFCGGLTTFSTFSVEVLTLLQQQRLGLAFGLTLLHVVGALCCTFLGMWLQTKIN